MGSSSSAQRSASSSRSDSVRSASTPRLPSREGFREIQLGAPGQPAAVGRPSPSPDRVPRSSAGQRRQGAMAQPEALQRQQTFGFSSAQPSYTVGVRVSRRLNNFAVIILSLLRHARQHTSTQTANS